MATQNTADEIRAEYVAAMGADLGEIFTHLNHEVASLSAKWNDFQALYGSSAERVTLWNETAPSFFGYLQKILWHDLLLHLCRLLDPPNSFGLPKLTLGQLPPLLQPPAQSQVATLVKSAADKALFARDWRNRRIGHHELPPLPGQPAKPQLSATVHQFQEALDAVFSVMHRVNEIYHIPPTAYERVIEALGGVNALECYLEKGLEAARRERLDYSSY